MTDAYEQKICSARMETGIASDEIKQKANGPIKRQEAK